MNLVFKYFPFICALVVVANAFVFRSRARRLSGGDETAEREYGTLIRSFVLYLGGWFIALGIGVAVGAVNAFAVPPVEGRGASAYDWALFSAVVLVNLRAAHWVYREDGAAVLARRGEMFEHFPTSIVGIRVFALVAVVASVGGSAWRMWAATRGGG